MGTRQAGRPIHWKLLLFGVKIVIIGNLYPVQDLKNHTAGRMSENILDESATSPEFPDAIRRLWEGSRDGDPLAKTLRKTIARIVVEREDILVKLRNDKTFAQTCLPQTGSFGDELIEAGQDLLQRSDQKARRK